MAFTYEVSKNKTVTILNDGYIFSTQTDDPDVEGYNAFATKARAEEWAEAAIVRYQAEILAAQEAFEAANVAAEAARDAEAVEVGFDGFTAPAVAEEPTPAE